MSMPRPDAEALAAQARQLLAGRFQGVLSTLSADTPGHPFGSVVPYCLGFDGAPVLLLSQLAHHTRNLVANPQAALTLSDAADGNVPESLRLTAVGEVLPVDEPAEAAGRYFRYFPQSRDWFEHLDFRFFRFSPARWHFNGGFATARWFGNERILRPLLFSPAEEAALFSGFNGDSLPALIRVLSSAEMALEPAAVLRLCGLDGEGMDIAIDHRLIRVAHRKPVDSPTAMREFLRVVAAG